MTRVGRMDARVTGGTAARWVRIVRMGNTFTSSYSSDGVTWLPIGGPVTIAMGTDFLIGLPVTSHKDSALGEATFSNLSLSPP
ncbi:MAG TPA: hypothetical protein VIT91_14385 [Chthoniobacterales bacterium]